MCAIILRRPKEKERDTGVVEGDLTRTDRAKTKGKNFLNRFFMAFNASFEIMTAKYIRAIKFLTRKRRWAILGLIIVTVIGFVLMKVTPTAFIPTEDDGFIIYSIKLPPGSSLARTTKTLNEAINILKPREEIMSMSSSAGYNGVDGSNSTSYAVGYIKMYPHDQRTGIRNVYDFADTIRRDLSQLNDATVSV